MRVIVAAVGRLKKGPERELLERYCERLGALGKRVGMAPVTWREVPESRAPHAPQRCTEEGEALLRLARDADVLLVFDEHGESLASRAFARMLASNRDQGSKTMAILIGGADGLSPTVLQAAHLKLSLGPLTLPHGLVRIVVAEQLYRAATILAGHPYHRD
jgi:23S rRNA (pseudouridine1915-N3)-methyltransferase